MNNRDKVYKVSGVVLMVALVGGLWFLSDKTFNKSKKNSTVHTHAATKDANLSKTTARQAIEDRKPAQAAATEKSTASGRELAALADMTKALYDYTRPGVPLSDLVNSLKNTNQNPVVTRNANPYTGEMAIVRTNSPLPGTRYFHAQYFSDESQKTFVQHMSFEYRSGEGAMGDVVNEVGRAFGNTGKPVVNRPDYVRYSFDDGYILWIKKMQADDLKDDPYNAYTRRDVGTIRVAIEAEIHGDEDHKSHH